MRPSSRMGAIIFARSRRLTVSTETFQRAARSFLVSRALFCVIVRAVYERRRRHLSPLPESARNLPHNTKKRSESAGNCRKKFIDIPEIRHDRCRHSARR